MENVTVTDKKKNLGWWGVVGFFASYFALAFAITFIIAIVAIILDSGVEGSFTNLLQQNNILLLFDALAILIALIIFKKVRQFLKTAFSLAALKKWKTYVYILAGFVLNYVVQFLILEVWQLEEGGSQIETFDMTSMADGWLSILLIYLAFTIITPIKEEIMFRGLLHKFLDVKVAFIVGLVVSSVIFGVLHEGHILSATIMGMIFVTLYRLTNSLFAPIILHILWNAYAITGMLIAVGIL
ncbi:type II CAAX endopeptidase family protein [Gracilibacillus sp. S3-1-1]|uniref:Type II CAAX endopeptidase family protein n=1 Tax=Gracilibacillus pellucidus TaxID=3095368 RepID=A0ACC6M1M6_9BACI|nr:type II CAAX endopeptidase family protein [Gracilibacillus sp. S3-1-1]MDX8044842.1 type II CAAX endopeptidase family protein [Gracilibacillus sp. S3-1-1]